jgi:hypothetical protein
LGAGVVGSVPSTVGWVEGAEFSWGSIPLRNISAKAQTAIAIERIEAIILHTLAIITSLFSKVSTIIPPYA